MRGPAEKRFFKKVEKHPNGCWLWRGGTSRGYGTFWNGTTTSKVHRWSYEFHKGKVPKGLELDHLCKTKNCVNPDHLEPVSHLVNMQRADCSIAGEHFKISQMAKTHCPKGHAYFGDNLILKIGVNGGQRRICRACLSESNRKYRTENREEVIEYQRKYRLERKLSKILESGIW